MILMKSFYEDGPTLAAVNHYIYDRIAPVVGDGVQVGPRNYSSCCSFIATVIEAGHTGDIIPLEDVKVLINSAFPTLEEYLGTYFDY